MAVRAEIVVQASYQVGVGLLPDFGAVQTREAGNVTLELASHINKYLQ